MVGTSATYSAKPLLVINNAPAPPEIIEDILQISVEESLHMPAMFTVVINNSKFSGRLTDRFWEDELKFAIGTPIKIGFISATTQSPEFIQPKEGYVVEGEITAIETHFTSTSQAPIVITGYDLSHRLHRGRQIRSFQNMTDTDIVRKIAMEEGIRLGTASMSGMPHEYVFQENQTNMEFLRERAARIGFELFMQDGMLQFRQPTAGQAVILKWLTDLRSLRVRRSSSEQVKSVEVRAWDYTQKKTIISTANSMGIVQTTLESPYPPPLVQIPTISSPSIPSVSSPTEPSPTPTRLTPTTSMSGISAIASLGATKPKMSVVDQPGNQSVTEKMAIAVRNELKAEEVIADGVAEGNPFIRPGKVITLTEMASYSGQYYVTETRHLYHERVYTTEFSVRGLRGGDLLATLSPTHRPHLQPGQTLMVGVVTDNKDPLGLSRVRVIFPSLTHSDSSWWARMVQTGAGKDRGFDCLPEVGDEVLVAFEHGDIHRPYILGGIWNGMDLPPESYAVGLSAITGNSLISTPSSSIGVGPPINSLMEMGPLQNTVRLRGFKTRVGHHLQFAEEDPLLTALTAGTPIALIPGAELFGSDSLSSLKGFHLKTIGGHTFDLCDLDKMMMNCVKLKTSLGHHLCLSDAIANPGISLKTMIGQSVSMIDLPVGMTPLPQLTLNTMGNVLINAGSAPIPSVATLAAPQLLGIGPMAAANPAWPTTAYTMLASKVINPTSTIEMSGGFINQFSHAGIAMLAGPLSCAKLNPEQLYINSPGVSVNAIPGPLPDIPTPGMINLNAMAAINAIAPVITTNAAGDISDTAGGAITVTAGGVITITAGGTVTITAPSINLVGFVLINGMLPLCIPIAPPP